MALMTRDGATYKAPRGPNGGLPCGSLPAQLLPADVHRRAAPIGFQPAEDLVFHRHGGFIRLRREAGDGCSVVQQLPDGTRIRCSIAPLPANRVVFLTLPPDCHTVRHGLLPEEVSWSSESQLGRSQAVTKVTCRRRVR